MTLFTHSSNVRKCLTWPKIILQHQVIDIQGMPSE